MYIYMAMCNLLGAPGEHNPARVFHTMQAHLHAWTPLGPCGPGPCGLPWALTCRALVGPPGPLWAPEPGLPQLASNLGPDRAWVVI